MAEHSFGWIQEPAIIRDLRKCCGRWFRVRHVISVLITKDIPAYVPERFGREALAAAITGENCRHIPLPPA